VNSPLWPVAVCLGALGLVTAGGWLLRQAPPQLDRALAALALAEEGAQVTGLKRPREQHRAERARRPAHRPSRPVSYDW